LAITVAYIAPPSFITNELGERPSDTAKRPAWDRGVETIETYRQRQRFNDPNSALGQERVRERQRDTCRQFLKPQRALGLEQHSRQRELGRSLGSSKRRPSVWPAGW
jgi:hypothetical protein